MAHDFNSIFSDIARTPKDSRLMLPHAS